MYVYILIYACYHPYGVCASLFLGIWMLPPSWVVPLLNVTSCVYRYMCLTTQIVSTRVQRVRCAIAHYDKLSLYTHISVYVSYVQDVGPGIEGGLCHSPL